MYAGNMCTAADFGNNRHCVPQPDFFHQPTLKGGSERTRVSEGFVEAELTPVMKQGHFGRRAGATWRAVHMAFSQNNHAVAFALGVH